MSGSSRSSRRRLVHKAPAKLDDVRNEINVTPLVDVCLVLLIIFMVIGPMLARGKDVPLPKTEFHSEDKDNKEPIVAVDQYGKIYVDKDVVADLEEMKNKVQAEWAELAAANSRIASDDVDRSGETRVLLKVDHTITYGQVYPVIMALHDMGAQGIDLGTNEKKEEGGH